MSQRYFEDVTVDEELTPVEKMPTVELAGGFTSGRMGGDNRFTNVDEGKRIGLQGAIVPGTLKIAWLEQFVSDWAGPAAFVTNLRVAFRRPDTAGKPLTLSGRVVDKRSEGGNSLVELEVVTLADGQPSVRANVQVRLPSRG
jgi:hypothetical protein